MTAVRAPARTSAKSNGKATRKSKPVPKAAAKAAAKSTPPRPAAAKAPKVVPAPAPPPPPPSIEAEVDIAAPPHRVWAALTSPDEINRWFTDRCEFEARLNGRVLYAWWRSEEGRPDYVGASRQGAAVEARIDAWEPRRSFTVKPGTWWPGRVTFRLEERLAGTHLTLGHEGWPTKDAWYRSHDDGWKNVLDTLRHYLEMPEPQFDAWLAKKKGAARAPETNA